MWECDYPHSDSTWPLAPETLELYLDGLPNEDIDRITHRNATQLYSFDMFSHASRERLTVGSLRAEATDVDLGFCTSERLRKTGSETVSVLDLASKLAT